MADISPNLDMDDVFGNSSTETIVPIQDSPKHLENFTVLISPQKLRQIQSEIVCRSSPEVLRPRAQSLKYHPYQNIPHKAPVYVNLPHRERKSILSMNSPNVSQQMKEDLDITINSDTSISTNGYVQMASPYVKSSGTRSGIASQAYCPFCNCQHATDLSMLTHIRSTHKDEMDTICQNSDVRIQTCCECSCQFFASDALSLHLLTCHKSKVVDIVKRSDNESCPYCNKIFKHVDELQDIFLYHILHVHKEEYLQAINNECPSTSAPFSVIAGLLNGLASNPGATTPGLYPRFRKLSCDSDEESLGIEICEVGLNVTVDSSSTSDSNKTCDNVFKSPKVRARRELRFSFQSSEDSGVCDIDSQQTSSTEDTLSHLDEWQIPVRVNSLSSVEFIELSSPHLRRKRKSSAGRKPKHKRAKSISDACQGKIISKLNTGDTILSTGSTKVFRRPKSSSSILTPPRKKSYSSQPTIHKIRSRVATGDIVIGSSQLSPLTSLKLFSQMSLFCCNICKSKFFDNDTLKLHVSQKHKGLLSLLRNQFGCGLCTDKFYDNKSLARHCLQKHTSLLEIREGPCRVTPSTEL